MTWVYLANARSSEQKAFQLLMDELNIGVIGKALDWGTTLAQAPVKEPDLLLVDREILPDDPALAIRSFREACARSLVIVMIFPVDGEKAAIGWGADSHISRDEGAGDVTARIRRIANDIQT